MGLQGPAQVKSELSPDIFIETPLNLRGIISCDLICNKRQLFVVQRLCAGVQRHTSELPHPPMEIITLESAPCGDRAPYYAPQ